MTLSEQLKFHRERHGLSQTAVAEKLQLSRQSISKWENGRSYPDIDNLILLSELYQVSIDELLHKNKSLRNKIKNNNSESEDTQKKFVFINRKIKKEKDEGLLLLMMGGIASFIFPLGLILAFFVIWRNKRINSFYKLIYVVCIFSILSNFHDGYVHLANYLGWGTVTIEKIE